MSAPSIARPRRLDAFAFGSVLCLTSALWHGALLDSWRDVFSAPGLSGVARHAIGDSMVWGIASLLFAWVAARGPRRIRPLIALVWIVLASAVALARIVDLGWFSGGGEHLNRMFFEHAGGDLLGMKLGASHWVSVGVATATVAVAAALAWRTRANFAARTHVVPVLVGCGATGLVLLGIAVALPATGTFRGEEHSVFPELRAISIWLRPADSTPAGRDEASLRPSRELLVTAAALGITIDPDSDYPLAHTPRPLDEIPRRAGASPAQPNVLVFFFESFSAALTSVYSKDRPGLTPRIAQFADDSLVFEGVYNAATPTLSGIVCSLTSHVSTAGPSQLARALAEARWNPLPKIFRDRGYDTLYLHQVDDSYLDTGAVVRRLGFDRSVDRGEVDRARGTASEGWGCTDAQMFEHLGGMLEQGEVTEPFFVAMPTMDTHGPFTPNDATVPYGDGGSDLLNSIHSTDRSFGRFLDRFGGLEIADRTIVLLVADHAMMPGYAYRALRNPERIVGRVFDEVTCILHSPLHELRGRRRVLGTQADLAPTLLHVAGIQPTVSHFEGRSLLEPFDPARQVIGATPGRLFIAGAAAPADEPKIARYDIATGAVARDEDSGSGSLLPGEAVLQLLEWKARLVAADHLFDGAPIERPDAVDEVDHVALLRVLDGLVESAPAERTAAAAALGAVGGVVTNELVSRLDSADPLLRSYALHAIHSGGLGNAAAAPRLAAFATDTEAPPMMRVAAAAALLEVAPVSRVTAETVRALLGDSDRAIRRSTTAAIARAPQFASPLARPAVKLLIEQLVDPEARRDAIVALGHIGGVAAGEAAWPLTELLEEGPRREIGIALSRVGTSPGVDRRRVALEVARFVPSSAPAAQVTLVLALGALDEDTPEVRRVLSQLAESATGGLRELAAQTLIDVRAADGR